jgi:hypothetical protein
MNAKSKDSPLMESASPSSVFDPGAWPLARTPAWPECAKAFPDLAFAAEGREGEARIHDWNEEQNAAGDQFGDGAGLFEREKGFWLALSLTQPDSQTCASLMETGRFYFAEFPWPLAVRLRGAAGGGHPSRGLAFAPWMEAAAERVARELPDNLCSPRLVSAAKSDGSFVCWTRNRQPQGAAACWGSLDLYLDRWSLLPDSEARRELAEDRGAEPEPAELAALAEIFPAFAAAFSEALQRDAALCLPAPCARHDSEGFRSRWSEDALPVCVERTAQAIAAGEAQELAEAARPGAQESGARPRTRI